MKKQIRTINDVEKRAKNSITIQIEKLIKKYGFKRVRLVVNKIFQSINDEEKLKKTIEEKEEELNRLRKNKK